MGAPIENRSPLIGELIKTYPKPSDDEIKDVIRKSP